MVVQERRDTLYSPLNFGFINSYLCTNSLNIMSVRQLPIMSTILVTESRLNLSMGYKFFFSYTYHTWLKTNFCNTQI